MRWVMAYWFGAMLFSSLLRLSTPFILDTATATAGLALHKSRQSLMVMVMIVAVMMVKMVV